MTECVADKPVLVMTWTGQDPSLPAVMLNSHTDVVPGLAFKHVVCGVDVDLLSFPRALDLPTLLCP